MIRLHLGFEKKNVILIDFEKTSLLYSTHFLSALLTKKVPDYYSFLFFS